MAAKTRTPLRWVRIFLPAILLIIWFAAAAIGGPTFGKLSSVSSNDQASFLPASAESTEALTWQKKFTDSSAVPAVIVIESDSTIDRAALADFVDLGKRLGSVGGGVSLPRPISQPR